ncbi:LAMI_0D02190g1_1 [Lachancea mirantina]|uniref:LAMI_0D02190g1_1 n=1 Tax=Lachancea mirantina TaxID=1230905 RepID=A0A1G4J921_9SACH|nr:LAMI_0D02190g1_1 [Lachancea mirantina]
MVLKFSSFRNQLSLTQQRSEKSRTIFTKHSKPDMSSGIWRFIACFFLGLATLAYCFSPDEIEIFQLQQEIKKAYGDEVDFYKFLKLPKLKDSSALEIKKNLKRLSKKYHPDKNKKYRKLYERLNLVSKILSDDSRRKTYDYYLKYGFPNYNFKKGGFYFTRVQPTTWFLILFVYVAAGLIHYVLLKLQNDGNKTRIGRFIRQVKAQDTTNGLGECNLIFKESEVDEGKKILVKMGDVYAVQPDGSEALITVEGIKNPSIRDSCLVKLPVWLWNFTIGRLFQANKSSADENEVKPEQGKRTKRAQSTEAKPKSS